MKAKALLLLCRFYFRTLAEATFAAGNHRVIWDGRNNQGSMVPSGIYFCRLKAGTFTANLKMLFVR